MPINCPLAISGPCDGCRNLTEDNCFHSLPPLSLRDILTPQERINALEAQIDSLTGIVPSFELAAIRRDLNNTHGMLIYLQTKLNEHLDRPLKDKQARKKRTSRGTEL